MTAPGVAVLDPRGRIYKGDVSTLLHTKYKGSGPHGFREEYFFVFSYCKSMKTRVLIRPGQNLIQQPFPTPMMLQINLIAIDPLVADIFMFESVKRQTYRHTHRLRLDSHPISSPCEPSAHVSLNTITNF